MMSLCGLPREFLTSRKPSPPAPPALLITTIGCFIRLCLVTMPWMVRAIWSAPPPVPAGTMNSTGRVGSQPRNRCGHEGRAKGGCEGELQPPARRCRTRKPVPYAQIWRDMALILPSEIVVPGRILFVRTCDAFGLARMPTGATGRGPSVPVASIITATSPSACNRDLKSATRLFAATTKSRCQTRGKHRECLRTAAAHRVRQARVSSAVYSIPSRRGSQSEVRARRSRSPGRPASSAATASTAMVSSVMPILAMPEAT